MSLKFNIIYTPGTVRYLSVFVSSLLKWSACSFRLVSNGCPHPERRYLQQLCADHQRLEYWTIPCNGTVDHGTALNYLQAMTTEDHFCFMDSDIFATGEFLADFQPHLERVAGVFAGAPIWLKAGDETLPASFRIMSGLHGRMEDGTCLGSSFFAIYDNHAITRFLQSTGVGFSAYKWSEIPVHLQQQLAARGWKKDSYDTAKVLNLLLQIQGHQLEFHENPAICHIGGVSFLPFHDAKPIALKGRLISGLAGGRLKSLFAPLVAKWRSRIAYKNIPGLSEQERQTIVAQRMAQRDPARRYFFDLLSALVADGPLPEIPTIGVAEIDQRIKLATEQMQALFAESAPKNRITFNRGRSNSPDADATASAPMDAFAKVC